jgi:hypothetical protein
MVVCYVLVCCVSVLVKQGRKEERKEGRKKCGGGVTDKKDCEECYIGHERRRRR